MKNKLQPKIEGIIPWCSTVYEKQTISAVDIEHWNGKEYLYEGYKSHVECTNGLEYKFYIDDMNSDGLSIPDIVQGKIERFGWYLGGGLDHDGLYAGEIFPRWLDDYIFREKNQYKDTFRPTWWGRRRGAILRNGSYYAVKLCGGFVWLKHSIKKVKKFREGIWIEIIACPERLFNELGILGFTVKGTSGKTGDGIGEFFSWIYEQVTGKKLKKQITVKEIAKQQIK